MAKIILPGDDDGGTTPSQPPSSQEHGAQAAGGLHIDEDWKQQAQAEKERLQAQEAEAASAKGASAVGPDGLPPADFRELVGLLITQSLMYMGGMPDPQTGQAIVSLPHAKHLIDLLGVLEEKTKGNTTEEEADELAQALREIRARFVELAQAVAAAQSQQAADPSVPIAGPDLRFSPE